jgi:molecular chaperone DnaK
VEEALGEAKTALNSDDAGQLKSAFDKLTSVSHKLAEAAYSQGGGAAGGPDAGGNPGQQGGGAGRKDDDVIDADFEEA